MSGQDCDGEISAKLVPVARMIIHRASVKADVYNSVKNVVYFCSLLSLLWFKIRQGIRARRIRREGTGTKRIYVFVLTGIYKLSRNS